MKFSIGELLSFKDNLQKLSTIKDIPAIAGYRIAKAMREISVHIADAEKAKNNLIVKYSGPEEDGKYSVLPQHMSEFIGELNTLASIEVDISIDPIELPASINLPDATALIGLDNLIIVK